MGQTGVGKSSLINALFGTDLKTDAVRPCTKEAERVVVDGDGGQLWFYDLPGIGEAGAVDDDYLKWYRDRLLSSDVVIWAIHADTRSVAFDLAALRRVLGLDPAEQASLMSRITFVLTKVDLLAPPPWILGTDRADAVFAPGDATAQLIAGKERYFQESFIEPFGDLITSRTHHDGGFAVDHPAITYDNTFVTYRGFLAAETAREFQARYPQFADVFERLADNYRIIPCSSLFRFNLAQVLLTIVNKLGPGAIVRFKKFTSTDQLNRIDLKRARSLCNIVVFDRRKGRIAFDLTELKL